jgi:hypothetical protein
VRFHLIVLYHIVRFGTESDGGKDSFSSVAGVKIDVSGFALTERREKLLMSDFIDNRLSNQTFSSPHQKAIALNSTSNEEYKSMFEKNIVLLKPIISSCSTNWR